MKTPLVLALVLLLNVAFATSSNIKREIVLKNETDIPIETTFSGIDYHFLLKMVYTISEEKVPAHLIKIIYTAPEVNGIKSEDIVNLFGLPQLTIQKTGEILELINVPVSSVFSINGLDNLLKELNWQFTDFYNSVISNINAAGNPVRNALDALGIDSAQFSQGIAFGDPDPYVEFKKGNFTYENLENATTQLGITLEELFSIVRSNSLEKLIAMNGQDAAAIFARNGIDQNQALAIWHNESIDMESIYNIVNLRNYLTAVDTELSAQTTLGVAIDNQTVAINKEIFNIWKNKSELIDITASAFTTPLEVSLNGSNPIQAASTNIVTLKANDTLYFLPVAQSNHDLVNCTLVTLVNNSLVLLNVNVTNHGESLELPSNTTSNVTLGTPLVCNNQIYGILRETNAENIIFDSFASYLNGPETSDGSKVLPFISMFSMVCFVFAWN